MKAIETRYAGCWFRSRLEARWAVFFDTLGIEWEYEPQGYTVDGYTYLPDFWLPDVLEGCHAEVRPPGVAAPEEQERLARVVASGLPGGLLLLGGIWRPDDPWRHTGVVRYHDESSPFYEDRYFGEGPFLFKHDVLLGEDGWGMLGKSGIQGAIARGMSIWNWPPFFRPDRPDGRLVDTPSSRALKAARSARFEYGQSG